MQITYLGHAGFCVETECSIIMIAPWLSKEGAFDAAWFQFQKDSGISNVAFTPVKPPSGVNLNLN